MAAPVTVQEAIEFLGGAGWEIVLNKKRRLDQEGDEDGRISLEQKVKDMTILLDTMTRDNHSLRLTLFESTLLRFKDNPNNDTWRAVNRDMITSHRALQDVLSPFTLAFNSLLLPTPSMNNRIKAALATLRTSNRVTNSAFTALGSQALLIDPLTTSIQEKLITIDVLPALLHVLSRHNRYSFDIAPLFEVDEGEAGITEVPRLQLLDIGESLRQKIYKAERLAGQGAHDGLAGLFVVEGIYKVWVIDWRVGMVMVGEEEVADGVALKDSGWAELIASMTSGNGTDYSFVSCRMPEPATLATTIRALHWMTTLPQPILHVIRSPVDITPQILAENFQGEGMGEWGGGEAVHKLDTACTARFHEILIEEGNLCNQVWEMLATE